ncbi:MAG: hypothetical protein Q7U04_16055 [Bacteriovorax sp.]|nr:hypothetical protein [Bacteriovorax sp.]
MNQRKVDGHIIQEKSFKATISLESQECLESTLLALLAVKEEQKVKIACANVGYDDFYMEMEKINGVDIDVVNEEKDEYLVSFKKRWRKIHVSLNNDEIELIISRANLH